MIQNGGCKINFRRCVEDAAPYNLNITKLLIIRFLHFKVLQSHKQFKMVMNYEKA